MKLSVKAGTTSKTVNVFIQDSSSATGEGLAGLVYNAGGLTAYYALPRAASVSITLATLAAVTSSFSSGGFKEIDGTNMPGWYRFDIPDAALASGTFVSIHLQGAADMAPLPIEIELTATDNQDAVRGGMTALPNANAAAANGILTSGTGSHQISTSSGQMLVQSGTSTGQISISSGLLRLSATGVDDIWDEALSGHSTPGTAGDALDAAGSAGDPWSTALPGAYGSGTAGKIVGDNLNATVSSRAATSALPTNFSSLSISGSGLVRLSATGVDDILDEVVEGSATFRQFLRGFGAALLGKASGAGTTTITFRNAANTKDVIIATVDASGNRSAITLDLT